MNAQARPTIVLTITRDRHTLTTTIERLVNLLDDLDGDPDLEPELGWTYRYDGIPVAAHLATADDREDENEHGREDSLDGGRTEHGIADSDALHDFRTMWSITP